MPKSRKATTIWVDGWLMFSVIMVLVCLSIRQVRADEDEIIETESFNSACRGESGQLTYSPGPGQIPETMDSLQENCPCSSGCGDASSGSDN